MTMTDSEVVDELARLKKKLGIAGGERLSH
jgi:hypothetical protein